MTETNKIDMLNAINEIEKPMRELLEITKELFTENPTKVDEYGALIKKREYYIAKIEAQKSSLSVILDSLDESEAEQIKRVFNNEPMLSNNLLDIEAKVQALASLQMEIMHISKKVTARMSLLMEEIKGKLSDLQDEKRRYDYYGNISHVDTKKKGVNFSKQT